MSGRAGAAEARLWVRHNHVGTSRLRGAQGTGVFPKTCSNGCGHGSGHHSKCDEYSAYVFIRTGKYCSVIWCIVKCYSIARFGPTKIVHIFQSVNSQILEA